ncbi:DUF929 domain-containing protein [Acidianus sulfidivorans JP7]|uniref:DUF929 domain-containing protein n=1 Tax=Acidianus sulfidivorans JP7 TaxID=619593 RepID=A0A2U9INB7_9CREN|nr:DUF929 domain-containing protein [Acidianus sulfidivorans]AWR97497.1 DUF929 domain-containing protein [Acidianus sulfidivorans JP7]
MQVRKIAIIILVVFFVLIFTLPYILQPFEVPLNSLFKVSNENFSNSGTCIVLISWAGCPFGAADSWVLYNFLSHYGNITFKIYYSDPNDVYPNTPGILFESFTSNSSIHFKFVYLYNRFLNATYNGTVVNNYVKYGLSVINTTFPKYFNIIKEYVVDKWAAGGFFQSAAYLGNPPHIPTVVIISGPKGTYMLIGHFYNPSLLKGYNTTYLLHNSKNLPFIISSEKELQEYI